MSKQKLILEYAGTFNLGFKPEQSLDTTIKQINELFFYPRHNNKALLDLVRQLAADYVITEQDRAEQSERRALSNQARGRLFQFIHKRSAILTGRKLARGLEMLLDYSDNPGAAEHNERVFHAFATNAKGEYLHDMVEERTRLMEDFINKMEKEDTMSQYYGLSDREVAAKFPEFFHIFLLGQESDNILTSNKSREHYNLSQECVKKLQNLRENHQMNMANIVSRFNMIIDPNYEILHYERIEPDAKHIPANVIEDDDNPVMAKIISKNPELYNFAFTIKKFHDMRGLSWVSKINHHLKQQGVDIQNAEVYDSDGKRRDYKAPFELDRTGLLRVRDKLNGREFLLQSNGVELLNVDPLDAPAIVGKNTDALVKAMDDADPWRIRAFTGSQAYADMKAAMKAVAQMRETLPENPSPNQRVPFNAQLAALEKACEAYLKTKDPLTDTTKESERLRINAANDAIRYARETRVLMSAQEKLLKERGTDEIESGMDKEQMQSGSDNALENLNKKMYAFYMKHMDENGPVGQLATDIMTGLSDITELPENPAGQLAKMVAFDLIMRERVSNDGNQHGTIESAYGKQPKLFCKKLEETASLQNLAGNMDVEGFQKFLDSAVSNNIFNLTSQALKDMGPQNEPLSKQDVPVLPEQKAMIMD